MFRFVLVAALATSMMFMCGRAGAQDSTAVVQRTRQAATATKYKYPLPGKVLKLSKELGLSADQISKLKSIEATLNLKERETTVSTTRNEKMLDSLFRTGKLNEGVIIFYTNRYGLYEGEYRGAVLSACYQTRKLLTQAQLNKLQSPQNHN